MCSSVASLLMLDSSMWERNSACSSSRYPSDPIGESSSSWNVSSSVGTINRDWVNGVSGRGGGAKRVDDRGGVGDLIRSFICSGA